MIGIDTSCLVAAGIDLGEVASPEQVGRVVGVVLDALEGLRRGLEGRKYFHVRKLM